MNVRLDALAMAVAYWAKAQTLSLIYTKLSNLGGSPQKTRRAFRQVQTLLLVSIESIRRAHSELWEKQMGPALAELDPDAERGTDQRSES